MRDTKIILSAIRGEKLHQIIGEEYAESGITNVKERADAEFAKVESCADSYYVPFREKDVVGIRSLQNKLKQRLGYEAEVVSFPSSVQAKDMAFVAIHMNVMDPNRSIEPDLLFSRYDIRELRDLKEVAEHLAGTARGKPR